MSLPDEPWTCPACHTVLDPQGTRLFCDACKGVMVTRDELREMLRDIHRQEKRALEQMLRPLPATERTCPVCTVRMDAFELNHIPIDLCFTHGYWFDRSELAKVLQGDAADSGEVGSAGALVSRLLRWIRDRRHGRS